MSVSESLNTAKFDTFSSPYRPEVNTGLAKFDRWPFERMLAEAQSSRQQEPDPHSQLFPQGVYPAHAALPRLLHLLLLHICDDAEQTRRSPDWDLSGLSTTSPACASWF